LDLLPVFVPSSLGLPVLTAVSLQVVVVFLEKI
jgi:hypothetical protein